MDLTPRDADTLKQLAADLAEIAALPVHAERAALWTRLNSLKPVRPLVWINEIPWHEINVDDELTLQCEDEWARSVEEWMRKQLYQWRHMPGDMVVSNFMPCPRVIHSTGFGINENVEVAKTDEASGIVSRTFIPQICEPDDIEKIKMPEVTHDAAATEERLACMERVLGEILPVNLTGAKHMWCSPWDNLIRWTGVEQAMMDLVMRPEMINDAVSRLIDAYLVEYAQFEKLNLLDTNNDNTRIGSGGYGYTDELPGEPFDPDHVRPKNMWGCATAQIFSEVSPAMHWEFALKHEMRWLERFGLTYYGCCEPLDIKMGILKKIPNLRKVSMSPWVDPERAAEELAGKYVYSCKPNPAILAEDVWRPDQAEKELRHVLDRTRDCCVEIILKDISTVRYEPQRLWDWARMAVEVAGDYE